MDNRLSPAERNQLLHLLGDFQAASNRLPHFSLTVEVSREQLEKLLTLTRLALGMRAASFADEKRMSLDRPAATFYNSTPIAPSAPRPFLPGEAVRVIGGSYDGKHGSVSLDPRHADRSHVFVAFPDLPTVPFDRDRLEHEDQPRPAAPAPLPFDPAELRRVADPTLFHAQPTSLALDLGKVAEAVVWLLQHAALDQPVDPLAFRKGSSMGTVSQSELDNAKTKPSEPPEGMGG